MDCLVIVNSLVYKEVVIKRGAVEGNEPVGVLCGDIFGLEPIDHFCATFFTPEHLCGVDKLMEIFWGNLRHFFSEEYGEIAEGVGLSHVLVFGVEDTFYVVEDQNDLFGVFLLELLFQELLLLFSVLAGFLLGLSEGEELVVVLLLNVDDNGVLFVAEFWVSVLVISVGVDNFDWEIVVFADVSHFVD